MEKQEQNEQENPVIGIQRDKINKAWLASIEVNIFDVEKFIEDVWAKYEGTEHEVDRKKLQVLWDKTMAMPTQGDPTLCPYVPGEPHLALMDIWTKAGDFWRAMYRVGDILYCDQYGHPLYNWMLGEKNIILQEKTVELERKLEHLNKKLEAFKADEREKQGVYQSEEKNFIAVDFETATNDRMACQIGIAVVKDGIITEKVARYIKPPYNRYDTSCQRVHHITAEMTADAKDFYQVWSELRRYFEEANEIWVHNATFDKDVLMKNLLYAGMFEDLCLADKFHCTMELYNGVGLHDLCEAFGMDASGHHDAGFDAECCAQFRINYLKGVKPDMSLVTPKTARPEQRHKALSGEVLKPVLEGADSNNPFYGRKVVVTGFGGEEKEELAKILHDMGADVDLNVSKRTNFVVAGPTAGPSKMEKVRQYQSEGRHIRVIGKEEVLAALSGDYGDLHCEKDNAI